MEAYASNKITLREPEPTTRTSVIRYAPSFAPGGHDGRPAGHHPYTAQSLAKCIGWLKPNGKPQDKIHHVLKALQLIEEGTLTESQFEGLTPMQMQPVVERARNALKQSEDTANAQVQKAEQAKRETEKADTAEERERGSRREKTHRQKAKAVRKQGRRKARDVARAVSTKLKSGEIGYKQARSMAATSEVVGQPPRPGPDFDSYINRLTHELNSILNTRLRPDPRVDQLRTVIRFREHLTDYQKHDLREVLHRLADRATQYAEQFPLQETPEPKNVSAQPQGQGAPIPSGTDSPADQQALRPQ